MAYVNLLDVQTTSWEQIFQHIRDFICKRNGTFDYSTTGIGWTLHDAVYATDENNISVNDYVVVKTTGELGTDEIYIRIYVSLAGYIRMTGYLSWDNSTHTGSTIYWGSTGHSLRIDTSDGLWIYGDLDWVTIINNQADANAAKYATGLGRLTNTMVDSTIQTTTSAVSSGTDVVIPVTDSTSNDWKINDRLYIKDDTNVESFIVKTNNGSNQITADLTNSYATNAYISTVFPYALDRYHNYFLYTSSYSGTLCRYDNTTNAPIYAWAHTNFINATDPANTGDWFGGVRMHITLQSITDGYIGYIPYAYAVSTTNMVNEDVLIGPNNNNYRYFNIDSAKYMVFKEV